MRIVKQKLFQVAITSVALLACSSIFAKSSDKKAYKDEHTFIGKVSAIDTSNEVITAVDPNGKEQKFKNSNVKTGIWQGTKDCFSLSKCGKHVTFSDLSKAQSDAQNTPQKGVDIKVHFIGDGDIKTATEIRFAVPANK